MPHAAAPVPPVLALLDTQLTAALLYTLQGRQNHARACRLAHPLAGVFLTHANAAMARADLLAARMTELDGVPNFDPRTLADRAAPAYPAGSTPVELLLADTAANEAAVTALREALPALSGDSATLTLFDGLLADRLVEGAQLAELVTFWCPPSTEEAPEAEAEVTVLEGQPYGHVPGGRIH